MNDLQPDANSAHGSNPNNRAPVENTASYDKRLAAFLLDSLMMGALLAVMFEILGWVPDETQAVNMETAIKMMIAKIEALSSAQLWLVVLAPYGIFFMLHGYSLFLRGQTIGKRVMGIAIVTLDNQKPPFLPLIFNRYLTQWILGMVPGLGPLLRVVDVLAIFRTDKRCVHDLIAKTKVIDLNVKVAVNPNSLIA
ncbi:MAG: RDD family protein [Gammaproteobacteria bacterium]|nr:MAG: RDD family protein [Gammaproteobacteria bacterium]